MRAGRGEARDAPLLRPDMVPAYAVCVLTMVAGVVWAGVTLTRLDDPALQGVRLHLAADHTLLGLGLALTGMVFAARRSAHALGLLLLAAGCALTLAQTLSLVAVTTRVGPGAFAAVLLFALFAYTLLGVVIYPLPLWLPSGRLPALWGRPYVAVIAVWSALQQFYAFANPEFTYYGRPTPLTGGAWTWLEDLLTPWMDTAVLWVPPVIVAVAVLLMAARWSRTPKQERTYAILTVPYGLWITMLYVHRFTAAPEGLTVIAFYIAAAAWPATLGYIHVRERTWALDRAGRRILTSFVLTFVLFMAYVGGGFVLSYFAPGSTTPKSALIASAALLVGVLLRPTSRWAARLVDRYYYGERAQPYQAVRQLADRLGHALDPGDMPRLLCDTVVHTLRLPGARLVISTRHGQRELARRGDPGRGQERFPLVYQGDVIGHLLVPPRHGELALDHQDREAVRLLADHSAPAIASLRLYEELQTSREQIVLAREEERRRLRHDLHDGLGPALSGLRLQVDAVRSVIPTEPKALRSLTAVSEGIGRAIDELRRITGGLAPAALDSADLPRALQRLAEQLGRTVRITVGLRPEPFPKLPAAVEVAVYRIAAEALNNAVRHAHADRAEATVVLTGEAVSIEVRDNGDGIPTERDEGVGLHSMAERAEELGGTFELVNTGTGTLVRAVMPCGQGGTRVGPEDQAPGTRIWRD
ncbi:histidine kinase [Streptomyces gardneri]|uniref:sensor histidine kinase n=1 Tax=Streptomyces gardneri TaxID=66892 RepID=UPI0006BCB37F|nr:GAF domain-containing sensor histidine kinase [Streptomyces gardneri]QPK43526.1 histidine kinase [Streptomyces gardneri]WRK34762.1 histidine kinase [Streptomyces venezuelae]CUM43743.1 two-component system sensor protein [Streptomyces venezuelae]